ncbi:DNA translocase FtsK [Drosophila kikkawai]|uniref:DNA translocase FtsK n=1 Tax=Drosophila kikkawai TaxID=30033 RepID=A0ABM4GET8_DROKI
MKKSTTLSRFQRMAALGLLLLVGVHGTTIISIKYPEKPTEVVVKPQPAKRDLSLSYAATNIDSKEGTRVKTITVIKSVGGSISAPEEAAAAATFGAPTGHKQQQPKLAIDPLLHKNPEWANAFRDNFDSYGALPDVPDIDDLFEFVNRKKPAEEKKQEATPSQAEKVPKEEAKPAEETTTKKAVAVEQSEGEDNAKGSSATSTGNIDSDEAVVEKIKGDAELLPHIKQANILRLQAAQARSGLGLRTKESLISVNYSTPMHQVTQYFDNYVQAVPNGYDYSKPCGAPPGNSIQVTTPSGRTYDIPQSNSSGTGGGNHPYLAPSLTKKTQIPPITAQPPVQQQPPPNYSSVNSIVPPIAQPQQPQQGFAPNAPPQQPQVVSPPNAGILPPVGSGGVSTSQRPYVAPRLRNNGLGISRAPGSSSTPGPVLGGAQPGGGGFVGGNPPSFRTSIFGGGPNRPNTLRSRGLKY